MSFFESDGDREAGEAEGSSARKASAEIILDQEGQKHLIKWGGYVTSENT